jgi:protein SCO1
MWAKQNNRASRGRLAIAAFAAALAPGPAFAGESAEHHHEHAGHVHAQHEAHGAAQPAAAQATEVKLADARLIDQNGAALGFKTDVIGRKIVVMDFVYTTCTTVCPVLSTLFGQVQGRLGSRVGRDVALVSVTVDPVRDTPARLKEYSARFDAGPGWIWLTGQKPAVDGVLKSLGAYTSNFVDHPALVLVGDGASGKWTRYYGFPDPDQIVAKIEELQAARAQPVAARQE